MGLAIVGLLLLGAGAGSAARGRWRVRRGKGKLARTLAKVRANPESYARSERDSPFNSRVGR